MRDLSELTEVLQKGIDEYDQQILRRGLMKIGLNATRELKAVTPVGKNTPQRQGTGLLKRAWLPEVNVEEGEVFIGNNTEYAPYVNYGHRIVRGAKTVGFVDGKFFMEKGLEVYKKKHLDNDINRMLDDLKEAMK